MYLLARLVVSLQTDRDVVAWDFKHPIFPNFFHRNKSLSLNQIMFFVKLGGLNPLPSKEPAALIFLVVEMLYAILFFPAFL